MRSICFGSICLIIRRRDTSPATQRSLRLRLALIISPNPLGTGEIYRDTTEYTPDVIVLVDCFAKCDTFFRADLILAV